MNLDLPDIYNAATTFVDENIAQGRGGKIAIYYQDQTITYQEVFEKVNRAGNAFKDLGIEIEIGPNVDCDVRKLCLFEVIEQRNACER